VFGAKRHPERAKQRRHHTLEARDIGATHQADVSTVDQGEGLGRKSARAIRVELGTIGEDLEALSGRERLVAATQ
jgi:hypothetical protein